MRIRNFRQSDIPILIDLQQLAAETDGLAVEDLIDFAAWSTYPELGEAYTVFVITDDDETNEWGQHLYLEALLPLNDPASVNLAIKCDMQPVDEPVMKGMRLYRREL